MKPSRHELRVAFGPTTLTCQRPHLALYFVDQVVQARQIHRGLFETTFRAPTTIPIEANPGGFLEQFAPLIGPVG